MQVVTRADQRTSLLHNCPLLLLSPVAIVAHNLHGKIIHEHKKTRRVIKCRLWMHYREVNVNVSNSCVKVKDNNIRPRERRTLLCCAFKVVGGLSPPLPFPHSLAGWVSLFFALCWFLVLCLCIVFRTVDINASYSHHRRSKIIYLLCSLSINLFPLSWASACSYKQPLNLHLPIIVSHHHPIQLL